MKGGDEAATLNFELREKQESGKLGGWGCIVWAIK